MGLPAVAVLLWEQTWERRTRRELEACRRGQGDTPLLSHWLDCAPITRAQAEHVYIDHFETEIAMSRSFAMAAAIALCMWRPERWLAGALMLTPATKLVAKKWFNEVEAGLPLIGRLAILRDQEVIWSLAAALPPVLSNPWDETRERLERAVFCSRSNPLPPHVPHPDEARRAADLARRRRRGLQRGLLAVMLGAAVFARMSRGA